MTGCGVCNSHSQGNNYCCRNSYDEITGVDLIRNFLWTKIFNQNQGRFTDARFRCFLSNLSYTLQYLEYLTVSHFEHPSQRNHASIYTILTKQYCSSVFAIIEAYLEFKWLQRGGQPPNLNGMIQISRTNNYLSAGVLNEFNWLRGLRNKLHLSKILLDLIRGQATNSPLGEYDWHSFGNNEYQRSKILLRDFLLEISGLSLNDLDFRRAFHYF